MSNRPRVLFIAHNHPSLHPGGSEIFAHDLFRQMKADGLEAMFLGCTNRVHREQKPGTAFQAIGTAGDEFLLWCGHFDHFFQSQIDLHGIVPELSAFLREFRPDVVHFHHSLLIGAEMLFLVRRVLPEAAIVFTLHDYYGICANHGQMITVKDGALCRGASRDACAKCFPDIPADRFVLRRTHMENMYRQVDAFVSPSEFLRTRYVDWGLEPGRVSVIRNGRPKPVAAPPRKAERRDAFAYFGNLSPFKGVMVALDAARRLARAGEEFSLSVHGGAPFQSDEFKAGLADAFATLEGHATLRGAYRAEEIPALMAETDWVVVPSVWWENAPLVIQEAFQHRRPVICSDIGGMAEMVNHNVSGLHFRAGDPASLAAALRRAMTEKGLWERLSSAIPAVPTMPETALAYRALYRDVLRRGESSQPTPAPVRAAAARKRRSDKVS